MSTTARPRPLDLPAVGSHVTGRHILGALFSGVIVHRRTHTVNRDEWIFAIRFDAPTELSPGDVREAIVFTGLPPPFPGDSWQDGHGGRFQVTGETPAWVIRHGLDHFRHGDGSGLGVWHRDPRAATAYRSRAEAEAQGVPGQAVPLAVAIHEAEPATP